MSAYQRQLRERQLVQNVSCKGNCHDNAAMESFFEVLKTEFFYLDKLDSTGPRPWLPRELNRPTLWGQFIFVRTAGFFFTRVDTLQTCALLHRHGHPTNLAKSMSTRRITKD